MGFLIGIGYAVGIVAVIFVLCVVGLAIVSAGFILGTILLIVLFLGLIYACIREFFENRRKRKS